MSTNSILGYCLGYLAIILHTSGVQSVVGFWRSPAHHHGRFQHASPSRGHEATGPSRIEVHMSYCQRYGYWATSRMDIGFHIGIAC